jgi:hypothetical protein
MALLSFKGRATRPAGRPKVPNQRTIPGLGPIIERWPDQTGATHDGKPRDLFWLERNDALPGRRAERAGSQAEPM